ncbi:MAG: hypothetical protein KDA28_02800, partial [Phycisphaerales bacterium]|nr:hypothetical protein [Phycisphaerales bacterium]
DRPMVEGHKGSLICHACLGLAHRELVVMSSDWRPADDASCTMCLMTKPIPHFASPLNEALICHECVVRAATTLRKDPETSWAAPGG